MEGHGPFSVVRLRSANRGNSNNTWNVNTSGNVNNNNAVNANRLAPDCMSVRGNKSGHKPDCRNGSLQGDHTHAERQNNSMAMPQPQNRAGGYVRHGNIHHPVESVIGFDALYSSMLRCRKGVIYKDSVAHYCLNGIRETLKLERELLDGTYKSRPIHPFVITSPKRREIVSISFRDRVYQRSLNDIVLYPDMARSFIYANLACQKGKGTDAARDLLGFYLRKAYRKWGRGFYVLQCDIHGYYPNMRHDIAKATFKKNLGPVWYGKACAVLDDQYPGSVGYNPGSQMVQIAGISVLDRMDHYIKEGLRCKAYLRYMDDFILIGNDRTILEHDKDKIGEMLEGMGFSFNPVKTCIFPISQGIAFLGYTFRLSGTGKVLMTLLPEKAKNERKRLRKLIRKARNRDVGMPKVSACYESWRSGAKKGNNGKLLQRMDAYYKTLREANRC